MRKIEQGLTVTGGGSLRNGQVVESNDFDNVYFVAADIEGSGMDGLNVGIWATKDGTGSGGLVHSVDGVANESSDWGGGRQADAHLSMFDDGAQEAKGGVR